MISWLTAGEADPEAFRMPVIVAALFVVIPAATVPVMGFGAIATGSRGAGWAVIAGFFAALGAIGTAATRMRPPVPALLVAGGTTLALVAGILLVPVIIAAMASSQPRENPRGSGRSSPAMFRRIAPGRGHG